MDHRAQLGKRGEDLVTRHLENRGMSIVARNFECRPLGELDIVAIDRDAIVFVEVKSRVGDSGLRQAIGRRQMVRLKRMAKIFLARNGFWNRDYRFFLVCVVFASRADEQPRIVTLEDPFPADR